MRFPSRHSQMRVKQKRRIRAALIILVTCVVAAHPAGPSQNSQELDSGQKVLWQDPGDPSQLDLRFGIGGVENQPQPPFQFISEDASGTKRLPFTAPGRGTLRDGLSLRRAGERRKAMSDEPVLTRREFTLESALAILSAATITITGCGDDDDNGTGTGPSGQGEVGTISANHGHTVTITSAQITAAGALTGLPIMGTAPHPHFIDLTAAQIVAIGLNQQVSVVSTTNDAHSHTVTFN